jgi:hypothetical protein
MENNRTGSGSQRSPAVFAPVLESSRLGQGGLDRVRNPRGGTAEAPDCDGGFAISGARMCAVRGAIATAARNGQAVRPTHRPALVLMEKASRGGSAGLAGGCPPLWRPWGPRMAPRLWLRSAAEAQQELLVVVVAQPVEQATWTVLGVADGGHEAHREPARCGVEAGRLPADTVSAASNRRGRLPARRRASSTAPAAGSQPKPSAMPQRSVSSRRMPPRFQPASSTCFPARSTSTVSSIAAHTNPCSPCIASSSAGPRQSVVSSAFFDDLPCAAHLSAPRCFIQAAWSGVGDGVDRHAARAHKIACQGGSHLGATGGNG